MTTITFLRAELLADIADAAFTEADIMSERHSAHELHQLTDICQDDSLPLTLRLLGLAFSEALLTLRAICVGDPARDELSDGEPFPEE